MKRRQSTNARQPADSAASALRFPRFSIGARPVPPSWGPVIAGNTAEAVCYRLSSWSYSVGGGLIAVLPELFRCALWRAQVLHRSTALVRCKEHLHYRSRS